MVVMRKNNRIEVVDEKDRGLYESKGYAIVKPERAKKQESGNGGSSQTAGASANNQNAKPENDPEKQESGNGGDNAKKNLEKDIEKILN
nr:MAG TPA: hypothetical protein [Caudoviricetes sp.]